MDTAASGNDCVEAGAPPSRRPAWPAGGVCGCTNYISPETGSPACLCPALLLGANESLLQQEDPADICCFQPQSCCGPVCRDINDEYLQLGNEGYRLCSVAMALQAACSCFCLGYPLVGWMAALQHQRVAAKYNLPANSSMLGSCLCYPHTLFQANVMMQEHKYLHRHLHQPPKPAHTPRRPGHAVAVGDGPLTSGIVSARALRAVRAASVSSEPIGAAGLGRISSSSNLSSNSGNPAGGHPGPGTPDPKPPAASQEISGFSVELSDHGAPGSSGGGRDQLCSASGQWSACGDGRVPAGLGSSGLPGLDGSRVTPRGHCRSSSGIPRTSRCASPIPEHGTCAIDLQQPPYGGEAQMYTPRSTLHGSCSSSMRGLSLSQEDVALSAQKPGTHRGTMSASKGRDLVGSWRKLRTSGTSGSSTAARTSVAAVVAAMEAAAAAAAASEGASCSGKQLLFTEEDDTGDAPLLQPTHEDSAGTQPTLSSRQSSFGGCAVTPPLPEDPAGPEGASMEQQLLPGDADSSSALPSRKAGRGKWAGSSARRGGAPAASCMADDVCNMGSCIGPGWSAAAAAVAAAAAAMEVQGRGGPMGTSTTSGATAAGAAGLRGQQQSAVPSREPSGCNEAGVGPSPEASGGSAGVLRREPSGGVRPLPGGLPPAAGPAASVSSSYSLPSSTSSLTLTIGRTSVGDSLRGSSAAAGAPAAGGAGARGAAGRAGGFSSTRSSYGASTKVRASSSWPAADLGAGQPTPQGSSTRLTHLQEVVGDDTTDLTASQEELASRLAKFARHAKAYTQHQQALTASAGGLPSQAPFCPTYMSDLCNLGGEGSESTRSGSLGSLPGAVEGELDAAASFMGEGDDSQLKGCDQEQAAAAGRQQASPSPAASVAAAAAAAAAAITGRAAIGAAPGGNPVVGAAGPGKGRGAAGSSLAAPPPMAAPSQAVMSRIAPGKATPHAAPSGTGAGYQQQQGAWAKKPPLASAGNTGGRPGSSKGSLAGVLPPAAAAGEGPLRSALSRGGPAAGTFRQQQQQRLSNSSSLQADVSRMGPAGAGPQQLPPGAGSPGGLLPIPGGPRLRGESPVSVLQSSMQSDLSLGGGSSYVMYGSFGGAGGGRASVEAAKGKTYIVTAEGGVIERQGCSMLP